MLLFIHQPHLKHATDLLVRPSGPSDLTRLSWPRFALPFFTLPPPKHTSPRITFTFEEVLRDVSSITAPLQTPQTSWSAPKESPGMPKPPAAVLVTALDRLPQFVLLLQTVVCRPLTPLKCPICDLGGAWKGIRSIS
ncbi:hypothetical protein FRC00_011581 [Tulasnella sp. 408]|nr:hypothetical protein FRC00_011581 [Tulasnella sp. 408]